MYVLPWLRHNAAYCVRMNEPSFDLVRLSKSKRSVDLASNTIREYSRQGLNIYRMGKAAFFSRAELEQFIRAKATGNHTRPGSITVRGHVVG